MNKKYYIILIFLIIFLSFFLNHLTYGNSNSTISNYEMIQYYKQEQIKRKISKALADYMYGRIQFYKEYNNNWYEQYKILWYMYEKLQEYNK